MIQMAKKSKKQITIREMRRKRITKTITLRATQIQARIKFTVPPNNKLRIQ